MMEGEGEKELKRMERFEITKWGISAAGAGVGFVFGGWTEAMAVLFLANILDFATGWLAGAKTTGLESKKSYIGIKRKILIWVMVVVGHMLDKILGESTTVILSSFDVVPIELLSKGHVFRDAIVIMYILNEILSITENCGRANIYVPAFIKKFLTALKEKEGGNDGNGKDI